jgi:hypothetical protein
VIAAQAHGSTPLLLPSWRARAQALWQLTIYVVAAYLAASAAFTFLLYPALLLSPTTAFHGAVPSTPLGGLCALFCLCLGAIAQTAISISDVTPASAYAVVIVTCAHFAGARLMPVALSALS